MSSVSEEIRFLLNGEVEVLTGVDPTRTVLQHLRYSRGLTGTKEGCAEGDCGACTVLVGELSEGDAVTWRAVNACITFLPMIDGRAVTTVEALAEGATLNPVQQAMVDLHGSQCGFCTPGVVMSLQGAAIGALGTEGAAAKDVLAGNLCRCTGYGPILAAAEAGTVQTAPDVAPVLKAMTRTKPLALEWRDAASGLARRWFSPRTANELAGLLAANPKARLVAGATDVGLWVTKQLRVLETVISTAEVGELRRIVEAPDQLTLGAAVRYAEALPALTRLHPEFAELVRRIGAVQVRNAGTVGGNVANGSPIGDMPPALIALAARVVLRKGSGRRNIPLEDYFIDYGRQDLRPGEFVEAVLIPRPATGTKVRFVKLSKRFDSDISAVLAAFAVTVKDGVVANARLAFGGMAATPRRAKAAEAALIGKAWTQDAANRAAEALAEDFLPLSDVRGTSLYRMTAAGNLIRRFWREDQGLAGPSLLELEPIDG
jgi:xanthine dehydrogenase small subunit